MPSCMASYECKSNALRMKKLSWIDVDDFTLHKKKAQEKIKTKSKAPKRSNFIRNVTQTNDSYTF